ncbi:MAG: hypothetical protein GX969_05995 [Firmicutes bacterium]|nr:hypothetical protein [Bacillota bacterium]
MFGLVVVKGSNLAFLLALHRLPSMEGYYFNDGVSDLQVFPGKYLKAQAQYTYKVKGEKFRGIIYLAA